MINGVVLGKLSNLDVVWGEIVAYIEKSNEPEEDEEQQDDHASVDTTT